MNEEGELIKKLMKQNGFNQTTLGEKLGVGQQQMSKYVSGTSSMDLDKFKEMCKLFDITRKQFFLMLEDEEDANSEEVNYNHKIKNVAPTTKTTIDQLIQSDEIVKQNKKGLISF